MSTAAPKAEGTDGGDVIQAHFGPTASGTKPGSASQGVRAEEPQKGAAKAGSDKSGTSRAAGHKSGTAKSVSEKGGTKRPQPAGRDSDDSVDPVPARAFSGRLLALAVVMIAITVMLAPTVKIYVDKSAEIAALEADIAARKAEQNSLKQQVSRWQDPNYVKQQARDRINMVMPGETGYWVFGSDEPAGTSSGQAGTGSAEDPANLPWVDALWESIRRSATD
jgi:cell division protein FtsB